MAEEQRVKFPILTQATWMAAFDPSDRNLAEKMWPFAQQFISDKSTRRDSLGFLTGCALHDFRTPLHLTLQHWKVVSAIERLVEQ